MTIILAIGLVVLGYLAGSVPWALVLVRWRLGQDIRTIGSGNVGANNVLRTGRKGLAGLTLLLDALKGAAPVWIAYALLSGGLSFTPPYMSNGEHLIAALTGLAAFLGHLYPVWLKFRGGKGVATGFGVILAVLWPLALGMAILWIGVAFLFRISSLSALVASGLGAIAAVLNAIFHRFEEPGAPIYASMIVVMTILVFWRHRGNIGRLRRREEPRIGQSRAASARDETGKKSEGND